MQPPLKNSSYGCMGGVVRGKSYRTRTSVFSEMWSYICGRNYTRTSVHLFINSLLTLLSFLIYIDLIIITVFCV